MKDYRLDVGLAGHYLTGWPEDCVQARLYRAATVGRPDDSEVDRILDSHCREHGEAEAIARLGQQDACDPRDPAGPPLAHPYFLQHRSWNAPGNCPATRARRGRVLLHLAEGRSIKQTAALEGVSQATVRRDARLLGWATCPKPIL